MNRIKGIIMIIVSGAVLGVLLASLAMSIVCGYVNLSVGLFFATIISFGWVDDNFSKWTGK